MRIEKGSATSSRGGQPATGATTHRVAAGLEVSALFVLLLIVAMRPLLAETYESGLLAVARAVGAEGDATPATTASFGLAIWLVALAAGVAAALRGRTWRWTGVELGAALLLAGAIISTSLASNKRLAINASCDWLSAIALLIVIANLCRDRWRIALVLAVVTASGVATAAKCAMQVGVEFDETRQMYEQNKEQFWRVQGVEFDDPRVELYERRMGSREASGFFPHSNTTGAWLSLAGFAALAIGGWARRDRLSPVCAVVAAGLFAAILMTGSIGALCACACGLVGWLVLMRWQEVVCRHWRRLWAFGGVAIVGGAAAVILLGAMRSGLPGDSLAFRWNYWSVTARIVGEHPWTGVGALNFDRAYLPLKPIRFPEEIKDPHNAVMAVLAQWGIAGGVGFGLVLLAGSFVAARRIGEAGTTRGEPEDVSPAAMKRWAFALIAGFVALRSVLFLERWGRPAGAAWVVFDIGLYGVLWAVCVTSVLWLAGRRGGGDDRGLRLACLCGVGAFLLQNMIDFSLFYPGSLTPFAAVAGVMLAAHAGENARPARAVVRGLPLALVLIGLAACLASLLPVIRASSELARARRDSSHAPAHYLAAAARDPLDPTPWDELAGWRAAPGPGSDLDAALEAMHQAITRDPANLDLYRKQSRLLEARYRKHDSAADLLAAIGAAEKVVELYPASPEGHAALADLLAVGAEAFDDPDAARQARGHYLTALDLDAARPAHEIRRWPEACRRQVQTRMNALPSSPGSAPANERGRS